MNSYIDELFKTGKYGDNYVISVPIKLITNKKSLNEKIFKLSEQDRLKGDVWEGPFNKPQIARKSKHRN